MQGPGFVVLGASTSWRLKQLVVDELQGLGSRNQGLGSRGRFLGLGFKFQGLVGSSDHLTTLIWEQLFSF